MIETPPHRNPFSPSSHDTTPLSRGVARLTGPRTFYFELHAVDHRAWRSVVEKTGDFGRAPNWRFSELSADFRAAADRGAS
jgi:hypothetical protein